MEKRNYRALLSQKQYLKMLAADLVSRFGDSLDAIAYARSCFMRYWEDSTMQML